MKSYTLEHALRDIEVIDWLLKAGAITTEDAYFMRNYVNNLHSK